jgi:hypothetical protein
MERKMILLTLKCNGDLNNKNWLNEMSSLRKLGSKSAEDIMDSRFRRNDIEENK